MSYAAINSWCETLVWVLAHSLWQAVLIAAVLWSVLRWLPARQANRRYGASVLALATVVLSSFATWSVLRLEPAAQPVNSNGIGPLDRSAVIESPAKPIVAEPFPVEAPPADAGGDGETTTVVMTSNWNWTTWLSALWFVGSAVMLARGAAGLMQARRLVAVNNRLRGFDLSVLEGLATDLCQRLGLKRAVRLMVSDQIRVPSVLGTLYPCVLIPVAMLSGVPVEQWRIILAHELAHIRRHDALVNLVQMLIESLLFFNPAVWWLSRQIRVEREACCDALAATACGPPLFVARALVEVAASLQEHARLSRVISDGISKHALASASLMGIAEPARAGDLTDRVQRLIDPDRASRPRVSGLGLATVLFALLLVGAALQQGTDLAVRAAAELMSPKERVDRLARLQAETNGVFLPAATTPSAQETSGAPPNKGALVSTTPSDEKLKVTVVVRTEDGSPIPKETYLSSFSATGNSSTGKTLDVPRIELSEYRRTFNFSPCRLRVGASAQGFAVAVSPLVNLYDGDPERTIELVLKRGTRATLKITDEQRRPIAGAELKTTARVSIGGGAVGLDTRTFKADGQGTIMLDRIGEAEYDQELRAAGFQRMERIGLLDAAAPIEWQLKPARPTRVQVVDEASGAPVAKARFELVRWERPSQANSGSGDPRRRKASSWLTFAETDTEGRAVLNELREGTTYVFGILAAGFGMALLDDIQGGQPERVVKLSLPLKLAGRVVGPLDQLQASSRNGVLQRSLNYHTRITDHVWDSGSVTVDGEGRFEITGLIAGEHVTFNVSGRSQDFVMKNSRADVELKIAEPAARTFPKREVVIRLVGTSLGAPARGTLYVSSQHPNPDCRESQNGPLPIRDDEIHMSIPVGSRLNFFPRNLAGYVIDPQDQREITAGDGPQIIEVPVRPAGGIHGTVIRADGHAATNAFVTVFASKLPPGEKDHHHINPDSASASSSFLVTLPLGGRYRVLARESIDSHNVWTVSDEVTLDESNPIAEVRLTLPTGRPLPIKVLGPDGQPVVDQPVHVQLGFSQKNGYSFGTDLVRRTGADGVALFEDMSIDTRIKPLELTLYVTVPPIRFMGWQATIDPRQPVDIRLQSGLSASGVLIEADTGKPIPKAEVRLVPRDFGRAQFKGSIRTKTNERGEFHFDGLENLEYTGYVDGSVPKGTIVTRVASGTQFSYPGGVTQHSLRAGAEKVRWEVLIYPGSSLTIAD